MRKTIPISESVFFRMLQFPNRIRGYFDVNIRIYAEVKKKYPRCRKFCVENRFQKQILYTVVEDIPEVSLKDTRSRDSGTLKHVIELK